MNLVMENCPFTGTTVEVDLLTSLGYILADDVIAKDPQPPFPASIKDGYAVISKKISC